jgi:hypothetical protein
MKPFDTVDDSNVDQQVLADGADPSTGPGIANILDISDTMA